jgi:hypothetical protein
MSFFFRALAASASPIETSFFTIPSPLQAILCITKNDAQNAQGSTNGSSFPVPESHHPHLHETKIPNLSSRRPEAGNWLLPKIPRLAGGQAAASSFSSCVIRVHLR